MALAAPAQISLSVALGGLGNANASDERGNQSLPPSVPARQQPSEEHGAQELGLAGTRGAEAKKGFQPYHSQIVPKSQDLQACACDSAARGVPVTTLMLRNIPNKYTQNSLMQEIIKLGFEGAFDFFYLPMDVHNRSNVGYAFINFATPEDAEGFRDVFNGHEFQRFHSRKVGIACDAHLQGLDANISHFQHRAVSVARNDQYRPVVFRGQERIKFEVEPDTCEGLPKRMSLESCSTTCSISEALLDFDSEAPSAPLAAVKPMMAVTQKKAKKQEAKPNVQKTAPPSVTAAPAAARPKQLRAIGKAKSLDLPRDACPFVQNSANSQDGLGQARQGLEMAIRELLTKAQAPAPVAPAPVSLAPTVVHQPATFMESPAFGAAPHRVGTGQGEAKLNAMDMGEDVMQLLSLRNLLVYKLLEGQAQGDSRGQMAVSPLPTFTRPDQEVSQHAQFWKMASGTSRLAGASGLGSKFLC